MRVNTDEIPKTILLVDDDASILEVTREMLSYCGYRVLIANSGTEAIYLHACAGDGDIDLTIMDMMMPGMSGAEAIRNILATKPDARIIVSSGLSLEQEHEWLLTAGDGGCLQKPYSIDTLAWTVKQALEG